MRSVHPSSCGAGNKTGMSLRVHRLQQGFSLLEALVAMAIASIALAVLYRTVGQGSKNVVDVEARVEAALVAKSVLASATFAEDLKAPSEGGSGIWRWSVQVSPEQVRMTEVDGRPVGNALPAARVVINITHDQSALPVLTWTTWKPYRSAP